MIGLPTIVSSSTSVASTPACAHSSAISPSTHARIAGGQLGLRARVHHHVAHPAHQVLAEADLGVHRAGAREHLAGVQVAEVPGHRGRADVERHPERDVVEARPDRRDRRRRRGRPPSTAQSPLAQRPLQRSRSTCGSTGESREPPVALERLAQALQVAARVGEVGLAHLDVVQPHDRIDLDRVRVGLLAHDLAMQLALRRHVDDEVAGDARVAPEPPVGGQARRSAVARSRAR